MFQRCFSYFVLVMIVVAAGCSDKVKVTGKVIFEDDKSPVSLGAIAFETDTFRGTGIIKKDGTYSIGTETNTDGVPSGKYKVTIIAYEKSDNPRIPPKHAVSLLYSKRSTTPLEIEVGKKNMTQDFEVKRP